MTDEDRTLPNSGPDIIDLPQDAHDTLLGQSYGSSIFLEAIEEISK